MLSFQVYLLTSCLDACPPEFRNSLADGIDARIKHCEYTASLSEQRFTRDFKYDVPSPSDTSHFFRPSSTDLIAHANSQFRLVRRYASESNDNSFILQQMLPAYRDASRQSGGFEFSLLQSNVADETLTLLVLQELAKPLVSGI